MIRFLPENIEELNENIPRDLLLAYQRAARYESREHPKTDHNNIGYDRRRRVPYRYGDAEYRKITPEEALRLIQQDPHNVEKIRGIRDGDLVEYEYKEGKFYALYANPNKEVIYHKPNGAEVRKKNIRYIANPKTWIPLLDTIYYTDEYDHPITDDEIQRRVDSEEISATSSYEPRIDPQFDRFKPMTHFSRRAKAIGKAHPDTGDHRYMKNRYSDSGYVEFDTTVPGSEKRVYMRLTPEADRLVSEYKELLTRKNDKFSEYSHVRKALKKLQRDQEDYDADEYQELLAKWTEKQKECLDSYNSYALQLSRVMSKLNKYKVSSKESFNHKFGTVLNKLEDALVRCTELKNRIDKISVTAANKLQDPRDFDDGDDYANRQSVNRLITRCRDLNASITNLLTDLEKAKARIDEIDVDSDEKAAVEADIAAIISTYETANSELETIQADLLAKYLKRFKELNDQMNAIEDAVNAVKPTRAARKAAKAQAAGQAVLDPAIAGIIQFVDDQETEQSA